MRVAGKLQRDSGALRDGELVGSMNEQDAGLLAIDGGVGENFVQAIGMSRVAVMYADDLHAVYDNFFVIQQTKTRFSDGFQVTFAD